MIPWLFPLFLCAPALDAAERPVCDPENSTHCSLAMKRGQIAPFDGQLLTPELAVAIGQRANDCDARLAIELARTSSVAAVELRYERQLARLAAESADKERKALEEALEASKAPWYTEPAFVVPVTVVATLGLLYIGHEVAE